MWSESKRIILWNIGDDQNGEVIWICLEKSLKEKEEKEAEEESEYKETRKNREKKKDKEAENK